MKNLIKVVATVLAAASMINCTGGTSADGGSTAATTFSVSGTLGLDSGALNFNSEIDNSMKIMGIPDTSGQSATQCSDGYYYQVYCMSFSDSPVAKTGNVTCSGATGAFTVAGLPVNQGIGCYVRRSSNGNDYATLATVEIPAASISGSTSTITASGDLGLALTISASGEVETEILTGGSNLTGTTPPAADTLKVTSGFYKVKCEDTASTEFSLVQCKCWNAEPMDPAYVCGGSKNPDEVAGGMCDDSDGEQEACVADNAAELGIEDTEFFVELNMYTATPASAMNMGNGNTIAAGTAIPVISIWGAANGTTSSRGAGGEGAVTSIKDDSNATVNLTWNSAQATNAIAWAAADDTDSNGIDLDIAAANTAVGGMPAFTANAGTWMNWVVSLMQTSDSGFTCTWATPGMNPHTVAGCVAQFADEALRQNRSLNLPQIMVHRKCDQTGCDETVANARIYVEGVDFAYNTSSWSGSQASAAATFYSVAPQLKSRFVFEPFEATPDGGGGFSQGGGWNRGMRCDNASGGGVEVVSALCDADSNYVNCDVKEEIAIRFVPTGTDGTLKMIFDMKETVTHARLEKWTSGGTNSSVMSPAVHALCVDKLGNSERKFFMQAVKQ